MHSVNDRADSHQLVFSNNKHRTIRSAKQDHNKY